MDISIITGGFSQSYPWHPKKDQPALQKRYPFSHAENAVRMFQWWTLKKEASDRQVNSAIWNCRSSSINRRLVGWLVGWLFVCLFVFVLQNAVSFQHWCVRLFAYATGSRKELLELPTVSLVILATLACVVVAWTFETNMPLKQKGVVTRKQVWGGFGAVSWEERFLCDSYCIRINICLCKYCTCIYTIDNRHIHYDYNIEFSCIYPWSNGASNVNSAFNWKQFCKRGCLRPWWELWPKSGQEIDLPAIIILLVDDLKYRKASFQNDI